MKTNNHVLLVDDEPNIREMVSAFLAREGYSVTAVGSCKKTMALLRSKPTDIVILDIMLPDGDGFSLFPQIRAIRPDLPILFLSAKDADEDRLRGLGLGADDYLTKPFLLRELELRIQAILRRTYSSEIGSEKTLELGDTVINWNTAEVHRSDGNTAVLTQKEYRLIRKLYENRGIIVTIDSLCEALWEGELYGYENSLMVHIRRLREKIEPDPSHPHYVLTVRGLGYRLAKEGE